LRATRCGPDTAINPSQQLTFYDPGLGSQPNDGMLFVTRAYRWLRDTVSQATGVGITNNIIDCYATLLRMWQPSDRVFLFGFSRGAYTVRCLASVLSRCGIPRQMANGTPLFRDKVSTQKIAKEAVKQFLPERPLNVALDLCRSGKVRRELVQFDGGSSAGRRSRSAGSLFSQNRRSSNVDDSAARFSHVRG
jgi:hypothetical protein